MKNKLTLKERARLMEEEFRRLATNFAMGELPQRDRLYYEKLKAYHRQFGDNWARAAAEDARRSEIDF